MDTVAYFEIQVDNISRAENFYKSIFGWKFEPSAHDPDYIRIETHGLRGGMLKRPLPSPAQGAGCNAFVCSVRTKNFDDTAKKILDLGGAIALKKFAIPNQCWQGYFIDTEGNVFGLFEVDENAA